MSEPLTDAELGVIQARAMDVPSLVAELREARAKLANLEHIS